jgi:MraZ protein
VFFQGANTLNLDAKGRLAIPAKYRERLAEASGGRVVVTVNPQDRCLLLYPEPEWMDIARRVSRLSDFDPQAKKLKRILLGNAVDLDLDSQGRILLSPELRAYAGLEKRLTLLGQGNKAEIWDEGVWSSAFDAMVAEVNSPDSPLSESLRDLSL